MHRAVWRAVFGLLWLAMAALPVAPAIASSSFPTIPDSIKDASAPGHDDLSTVSDNVATVVKALSDGTNPAGQQDARNWLIQGAMDGAGNAGSAEYVDAYAQIVNSQLLAAVSDASANIRTKVEAALAVQKIASSAHSAVLVPVAVKLLSDPNPTACYMGMKAAEGLLPEVMSKTALTQDDHKLLTQILAAVADHPNPPLGAPIADEAYYVLNQPVVGTVQGNPEQIMKELVPTVMALEEQRLKLYTAQAPQSPRADAQGVVFLLSRQIWLGSGGAPGLSLAQQKQTMQIVADLISLSSKCAQSGNDAGIAESLQYIGRELNLFADPTSGVVPNQDLNDAGSRMANLGVGAAPQAIGPAADAASQAVGTFSSTLQ